MTFRTLACLAIGLFSVALPPARAWDYEGHRIVNQIALVGLPPEFPDFVRAPAAAERIAFLAGEPDRWRNTLDLPIKHYNGLDHYLDWEQLAAAGLSAKTISPLRYQFAAEFAAARATHASTLPTIDSAKNADRSQEWPGFLPWAITEYYGKLVSAFSYLKAYQEHGTPTEIANAEANILYLMGVMGHYVGDGSQPLHLTVHHNGWVGDNPRHYSTWPRIHAYIDGGFIARVGITTPVLIPRARPARVLFAPGDPCPRDLMFDATMSYLATQQARVVELYELDKARAFDPEQPTQATDGRAFIEEQLLRGGQMLADIWLTAWTNTTADDYLKKQLLKRQAAAPAPETTPTPTPPPQATTLAPAHPPAHAPATDTPAAPAQPAATPHADPSHTKS